MDRVSKPLLGLLVATVAFFALWLVALRPSNSSNSANGTGGGVGQYQPAINAAKSAVGQANRTSTAQANASATSSGSSVAQASTPAASTKPATSGTAPKTPTRQQAQAAPHAAAANSTAGGSHARQAKIVAALKRGEVLALVFYNPAAADDRAVAAEVRAAHHKGVLSLAVPVAELSKYGAVTNQVPVTVSPTLVLIDRHRQASWIVGYASGFEIAQRIADAVAAK